MKSLIASLVVALCIGGCSEALPLSPHIEPLERVQVSAAVISARPAKVRLDGRSTMASIGRATTVSELATSKLLRASTLPVPISTPTDCDWQTAGWGARQGLIRAACVVQNGTFDVIERISDLDRFVRHEIADAAAFGWLALKLARDSEPLVVGLDVYVQVKLGPYTPCSTVGPVDECGSNLWHEQTWGVRAYRWIGRNLVLQWERSSSWHPSHTDRLSQQWEPLFQAAIVGPDIYIPEAEGRVARVNRATGELVALLPSPAPAADGFDTEVSSGLTTDRAGNVYYTAMTASPTDPFGAKASWIVRARPDNTIEAVSVVSLADPDPACVTPFSFRRFLNPPAAAPLPWPPEVGAIGPTFGCGETRVALNATPAVTLDGSKIFFMVRTRQNADHASMIALDGALTKRWQRMFRNFVNDACGVLIPATAEPGSGDPVKCRVGTPRGVSRETGLPPAPKSNDLSISSPMILVDGSIAIGSYGEGDNERGRTIIVEDNGVVRKAYNFGWLVNAVSFRNTSGGQTRDTFVINDSHYDNAPFNMRGLDVQQASSSMLRWVAPNTTKERCELIDRIKTCTPVAPLDGTGQQNKACWKQSTDDACSAVPPGGAPFDFITRTPAVQRDGTFWAVSSDGHAYRFVGNTGVRVGPPVFVDSAAPQTDTPISIDSTGRVYVMLNGSLAVLSTTIPTL